MDFQPVLNVALIAPEIPQNTGNLIRLCSNIGARLNLIEPLGFRLDDRRLRRASLDYSDLTDVLVYNSIDKFLASVAIARVYAAVPHGSVLYTTPRYQLGDTIVFGSESVGLPSDIVDKLHFENRLRIPMAPANRSLNLSNAAAVVVYEMWRQVGFYGASTSPLKSQAFYS